MKSRLLGTALLVTSAFFALAAIWIPEYRWELLATTVLLFLTGESLRGQKKPKKEKRVICLNCQSEYPASITHNCSFDGPHPPPSKRPGNTTRRTWS